MQVRWHGHSCFEFSDGNVTVVTDPHDGKSIGIKPPRVSADVVLMSHDHYDHNAARVVGGNHKDHMFHNGRFESKGMVFHGYPSFHDEEAGKLRGEKPVSAAGTAPARLPGPPRSHTHPDGALPAHWPSSCATVTLTG